MNILVLARHFPTPDRSAGDLRLSETLTLLAAEHAVTFCASAQSAQVSLLGQPAVTTYRRLLEQTGARIADQSVIDCLKSGSFELVVFQVFHMATWYLSYARYYQPSATMMIDTVDIHFERLLRKAALTGSSEDQAAAIAMQTEELEAYAAADLLVTCSESDSAKVRAHGVATPATVIPIINRPTPLRPYRAEVVKRLVFVGGFTHQPNEDAMLYFCAEIFPKIVRAVPDATLTIVGNAPTDRIRALQGPNIAVLGYVPDVAAILRDCGISVAPLRYGSSLKGKIGEALAAGLPVVTTTIGAEGFGLTDGENVLLGDTAEAFAARVVDLVREPDLYRRIQTAGWTFFGEHFGTRAVADLVAATIATARSIEPKRMRMKTRIATGFEACRRDVDQLFARHVAWRFRRA